MLPINLSPDDRGLNRRLVGSPAGSAGGSCVRNMLGNSVCCLPPRPTNGAAKVALKAGYSPTMLFLHSRELVPETQG